MPFIPKPDPADRLTHTVAFRLTDAEYLDVMPFFEAFGGQASPAIRWLLNEPSVQALMARAMLEANA